MHCQLSNVLFHDYAKWNIQFKICFYISCSTPVYAHNRHFQLVRHVNHKICYKNSGAHLITEYVRQCDSIQLMHANDNLNCWFKSPTTSYDLLHASEMVLKSAFLLSVKQPCIHISTCSCKCRRARFWTDLYTDQKWQTQRHPKYSARDWQFNTHNGRLRRWHSGLIQWAAKLCVRAAMGQNPTRAQISNQMRCVITTSMQNGLPSSSYYHMEFTAVNIFYQFTFRTRYNVSYFLI